MSVSAAQAGGGTPLLPTRVHLFFRNVQGVWACTNPACSGAPGDHLVDVVPGPSLTYRVRQELSMQMKS